MAKDPLPYLTPERALIFRVTHVANLAWTLEHGLVCQSSPLKDPGFRRIGSADVIAKRERCVVPIAPGGTLADYVPFYFTPLSMMLLNIVTGYRDVERVAPSELIILASSIPLVQRVGGSFVFTDRHALLSTARFSSNFADLPAMVDWKMLQNRDFRRDPEDPGKTERYQAEALIHGSLPVAALGGLACSSPGQIAAFESLIRGRGVDIKVIAKPEWFFQ